MNNQILTGDCVRLMESMPDDFVDLTVTSPPYGNLRIYGGEKPYSFEVFKEVAGQLARITKPGGVIVWVVKNHSPRGRHSETCQAEREKLYFVDELGMLAYETIIGLPSGVPQIRPGHYYNGFDFVYVFSKGRPAYVNILKDRKNKSAGTLKDTRSRRQADGVLRQSYREKYIIPDYGYRTNVWTYPVGGRHSGERYTADHPARMPEKLARDLILSYCRPGELVFDPFCGSGTTLKISLLEGRNWLGCEIHLPYVAIAKRRLRDAGRRLINGLSV